MPPERWERLKALLCPTDTKKGRPRADNELVAGAIHYIMVNRKPWSQLPPMFGSKSTAQARYKEWESLIQKAWPDLYIAYGNRRNVK